MDLDNAMPWLRAFEFKRAKKEGKEGSGSCPLNPILSVIHMTKLQVDLPF